MIAAMFATGLALSVVMLWRSQVAGDALVISRALDGVARGQAMSLRCYRMR